MQLKARSFSTHPGGERVSAPSTPPSSWPVDTPGGRFYAEFDPVTPISREGQLVFFAQFLHASQRWERFLQNCPLSYTGNRGKQDRQRPRHCLHVDSRWTLAIRTHQRHPRRCSQPERPGDDLHRE